MKPVGLPLQAVPIRGCSSRPPTCSPNVEFLSSVPLRRQNYRRSVLCRLFSPRQLHFCPVGPHASRQLPRNLEHCKCRIHRGRRGRLSLRPPGRPARLLLLVWLTPALRDHRDCGSKPSVSIPSAAGDESPRRLAAPSLRLPTLSYPLQTWLVRSPCFRQPASGTKTEHLGHIINLKLVSNGNRWFLSAPNDGPDLHSSLYLLKSLQDPRVLRLESPIHGNILCRILAQKNQCVANVIGLVYSLGDLAHHLALFLGTNALRCFNKQDWHVMAAF